MPLPLPRPSELQAARVRAGLTVSALAQRLGVSQAHLGNVERGHKPVSAWLVNGYRLFAGFEDAGAVADTATRTEGRQAPLV